MDQANQNAAIQASRAWQQQGAAIAAFGASGVTEEGSPLDVLQSSAMAVEMDRQTILYRERLQALGYTDQAQLDSAAAGNAVAETAQSAVGVLLNSAATDIAFFHYDELFPLKKKGSGQTCESSDNLG